MNQIKTKPLRILVLALYNDTVASSRTRVFQFLPYLRKRGIHLKVLVYNWILPFKVSMLRPRKWTFLNFAWVVMMKSSTLINRIHQKWIERKIVRLAGNYDRVFIQKIILPAKVQCRIKKMNPNIVFDMDDAIYLNTGEYKDENLRNLHGILKLAVVENESTKGFFEANGVPSLTITGPIDCQRYRPCNRPSGLEGKVVLGWVGTPSSTIFLEEIRDSIKMILESDPNCVFEFIGCNEFMRHPRIAYRQWSLRTEVELLARFDIGLMPLRDDEWCRGKGGYKLLQYMAMGIPSIVSPVGVNSEILINGETGFFARNQNDWADLAHRLIADPALRIDMGRRARRRAQEAYSYERYSPILMDALEAV